MCLFSHMWFMDLMSLFFWSCILHAFSNIYGLSSISIVCLVYFLWIFCFASSHFHILFPLICGWCLMFSICCCPCSKFRNVGQRSRTSWNKRGVVKSPQLTKYIHFDDSQLELFTIRKKLMKLQ